MYAPAFLCWGFGPYLPLCTLECLGSEPLQTMLLELLSQKLKRAAVIYLRAFVCVERFDTLVVRLRPALDGFGHLLNLKSGHGFPLLVTFNILGSSF